MRPLRILCVCSHNRTRSVLVGGLLTAHFQRDGAGHAVRTGGFGDPNLPPTSQTVRYLAGRGIDVSGHRSTTLSDDDIDRADLIVTAEQMHVVEIVARRPESFAKSFTLPELVERLHLPDHGAYDEPAPWLAVVNGDRDRGSYLTSRVAEIADPTGASPTTWRAAFGQIDTLTAQLADALTAGAEVRR